MSRSLRHLLPDIRTAAPGVPDFLALHHLSRAYADFLDRSEAWRQWTVNSIALNTVTGGLVSWPNHLNDPLIQWARIKRIDMLQYFTEADDRDDGEMIPFMTEEQLQHRDWRWRDREGGRPLYFTRSDEIEVADGVVSQHTVRLYPIPQADALGGVQARCVVVTDTVADFDLSATDHQIPQVPDRVFYGFRYPIVCGALAHLYLIPGKDWSDPKLAAPHMMQFEMGIASARSRSDRDYNNAALAVQYGGL